MPYGCAAPIKKVEINFFKRAWKIDFGFFICARVAGYGIFYCSSCPVLQVIVQHALIEEKLRKHLRKSAFVSDEQRKLMRDKELTGASPCLAVCRILIATFQRLMNKPHSHKTKKSLVEPSPWALKGGGSDCVGRSPDFIKATCWLDQGLRKERPFSLPLRSLPRS